MGQYVARRLIETVPVLLLASIAVFALLRLVPGDPAVLMAGQDAGPEVVEAIREELGLTKPLPAQYASWLGNMLTGDLGVSYTTGQPVADLLAQRVPATLELAVAAYALATVMGIPLGIAAGLAPRSLWDYGLTAFTVVGLGIPNFLLGIVLLIVFSVKLGFVPAGGRVPLLEDPAGGFQRLALPAIALGMTFAAILARFVRSSILDTMSDDYIRTARAKGLSERVVVMRHALRNSLIPVITVMGLQVGRLLTGSIVVETVFAWPGIGRLVVSSIQGRDYPVVQSLLLVLVAGFILVNLLVDLAYGVIDPRIRVR